MLEGRQRLTGSTFLRIAERPAIGLDPGLDRAEELALPVGQVDARPFSLSARPPEGVEGGPPRRLPGISGAALQISPIAER